MRCIANDDMGELTISEKGKEMNKLFPVFIKLEQLRLLIVGGGVVGMEKLNTIMKNSPATQVKLVAISISDEVKALAEKNKNIQVVERHYLQEDLNDADLVIVAVNDKQISQKIQSDARSMGKLINVADTPDLCDFYLGSIVGKGNLKIAISTNGKSPTIAKRLKEVLTELLPDQLDDLLDNMQAIRGKLNGDFATKITRLNEITRALATNNENTPSMSKQQWKRIAFYFFFAFFFLLVGYLIRSYIPF